MELLPKLREIIASYPNIRFAVLFGSRARGDAAATSDIDLALDFYSPPDILDLGDIISRVSESVSLSVDLTDLRHLAFDNPILAYSIAADGIIILENERDSFLRFKNIACGSYFDAKEFIQEQNKLLAERLDTDTFGRPLNA